MQGIMKRKTIGLVVASLYWPLIAIYAFFRISGVVLPIIAILSGPVGLLIMGSSVDGKPGLLGRIFKICGKIAKWGWLLIPYFPIDIIVGLVALMIGIWFVIFSSIFLAFIPALIDFLQTLIAVKKGRV